MRIEGINSGPGAGELTVKDCIQVLLAGAEGVRHTSRVFCCASQCAQLGVLTRDTGYDRGWLPAMAVQFRLFLYGQKITGEEL
jgi:hypothetical protein